MPGPVAVKHFRGDDTIMMCRTEVYDNKTCLPFALLPLFDEQRMMYKAMRLVAKVPAIVTLGCMVDGLFCTGTPEAKAAFLTTQCLPDHMVPQDLVGPTLFLASDASTMMTGQTMVVDAGVVTTG